MHSAPADDVLAQRLAAIEARLNQIEQALKLPHGQVPEPASAVSVAETLSMPKSSAFAALDKATAQRAPAPKNEVRAEARAEAKRSVQHEHSFDATQLLGWSGATALVLAAIYLIRLGIDSGWLTPVRQLALAAFGAGALIAGGVLLRRLDRQYAAFLPAAGIVVLFATVYGAHLYYGLISGETAVFAVVGVALLALWLGALFESELYGLFAVLGSYSAPLFLPELRGDMGSLVIYFTVWSLAFSFYALMQQRRSVYMLAMYLALVVFSWLFELHLSGQWQGALLFQSLQFAIFLTAAALFALRSRKPMSTSEAWLHFPALLLFYALQYDLLNRHVPELAPWIALLTAGALLGAYLLIRRRLSDQEGTSGLAARGLVSAYLALVLLHSVYMNLLPESLAPWVGLALILALRALLMLREKADAVLASWPFMWAALAIVLFNVVRVLFNWEMQDVPASPLVLLLYPALSYFAYLKLRDDALIRTWTPALLIFAHLSAMSAATHLIDTPALVSVAWLAVASVALAGGFMLQDRRLGQSSLLLFLLAGLKIILFDLAGTEALLRVGVLLVLGVSLYAGGWVYRKLPPKLPPA